MVFIHGALMWSFALSRLLPPHYVRARDQTTTQPAHGADGRDETEQVAAAQLTVNARVLRALGLCARLGLNAQSLGPIRVHLAAV